jgi:Tol biopolymer transport system component
MHAWRRIPLVAPLLCLPAATAFAVEVTVDLDEVTNMAAAVSPDGSELIVDAQGVLWRLPIEGGEAEQVTDFTLEPARPDWSPNGDAIVFQSYTGGTFDVWTMAPDGSNVQQLTEGPYDEREPTWSPDGSQIAFVSDRGGSYDVWSLDVASGELRQWTSSETQEAYPAWSPDGSEIAYVVDDAAIEAIDQDGATRTLAESPDDELLSPSWSPSGEEVAYVRLSEGETFLMLNEEEIASGEDVFPFRPEWLDDATVLYTADGKIRVRDLGGGSAEDIQFSAELVLDRPEYDRKDFDFDSRRAKRVTGIVTPALSPDGQQIAFAALNDLWLMEIGKKPRRLTEDAYWESDPAWSSDGTQLAYVSDKAGTPDIHIRDLATDSESQLTSIDGAELYPAWSPDGSRIAFHDQNGVTSIVDVASGSVQQVADSLFGPGRPSWSADGSKLAFAAVVPYSARFREGTSQILVVDVESGEQTFVEPAPNKSIALRGDNGPVWSPDGSAMAFIMDGWLWVAPVDGSGEITDDPVRVTDELADSPTWSGDSSTLLYLANGELKLVGRDGGNVEEVALRMGWLRERPRGSVVIRAGRLWDGRSPEVQYDVDITVVGNRIERIEPHDDGKGRKHGDRFIDASHLTVIPGLFEGHTHQTWGNHTYGYGGRQGRLALSYGITSTLSVGDFVYRAMADREALAAGSRIGPRFFATGEPLDGSRIYYNGMRPITSDEQFQLELERARVFDYDILKTYVRLKPEWMAAAAKAAHDLGIMAVSHFLSPGVLLGQDGTTHLGATERLDYSRIRTLTGESYDDVISLFADAGMYVTTTCCPVVASLYQDGLIDDPRIRTLLPSWERQELVEDAPAEDEEISPATLRRVATLAEIFQRGGSVLAGSDTPLDKVAVGLHSDLRWLATELTPFEVLQTATTLPAKELGADGDLGTVEPGKLADLAFVEGSPHEAIEDLVNVRMVMKNGKLFTVEELMEPYAGIAATD